MISIDTLLSAIKETKLHLDDGGNSPNIIIVTEGWVGKELYVNMLKDSLRFDIIKEISKFITRLEYEGVIIHVSVVCDNEVSKWLSTRCSYIFLKEGMIEGDRDLMNLGGRVTGVSGYHNFNWYT